jgi:hypothetical protein
LLRLELDQLVANRVEEAAHSLREEVSRLKLLLAHVGDSLEPTKASPSNGLALAKAQALVTLDSSE